MKQKHAAKTHRALAPEDDRRHYARASEVELVANINGRLVEVWDISLSGVRICNGFPLTGDVVSFSLIPRVGQRLDVNRSLRVKGRVLRVNAEEHSVAILFDQVNYSLAKLIVNTLSRRSGVSPFIFS